MQNDLSQLLNRVTTNRTFLQKDDIDHKSEAADPKAKLPIQKRKSPFAPVPQRQLNYILITMGLEICLQPISWQAPTRRYWYLGRRRSTIFSRRHHPEWQVAQLEQGSPCLRQSASASIKMNDDKLGFIPKMDEMQVPWISKM